MSSDSTKPLVFISYAHLDEPDPPEQPAEGKICWLSISDDGQPRAPSRWTPRFRPMGKGSCSVLRRRAASAGMAVVRTLEWCGRKIGCSTLCSTTLTLVRADLVLGLQSLAIGASAETTLDHTRGAFERLRWRGSRPLRCSQTSSRQPAAARFADLSPRVRTIYHIVSVIYGREDVSHTFFRVAKK
jgi:hypothetical protein